MKRKWLWLAVPVMCILLVFAAANPVKRAVAKGLLHHAEGLYDQGKYKEAAQVLERSIRLDPHDSRICSLLGDTYFLRAEGLRDQGNYNEAAQALERSIQLDSYDRRTFSLLGDTYFLLGRDEDAVKAYGKSIEISSDDFKAHNMLGNIYSIQGRTDKAVEAYMRAATLKPDDPNIQFTLGTVYEDANQPLQAIERYGIAVRLDPNFVDAHLRLGYVYESLRDYERAIVIFRNVVRLKPDYAWGHRGLGSALCRTGDLEHAVEEFKEVIRLDAGALDPYVSIARAYARWGRYNEAIEFSKRALELAPKVGRTFKQASKVGGTSKLTPKMRETMDLYSKVGGTWELASRMYGTIAEAHFILGAVYFETGEKDLVLKEHVLLKDMGSELADSLLKFMQTDGNRRDLSTPSTRLIGHWRSVDGDEIIYSAPDPSLGVGTYRIQSKLQNSVFRFKVISEDVSGTSLVIRNFNDVWAAQMKIATGLDLSQSDVSCSMSKDGRRMTQECAVGGVRSLYVYEYVPACGGPAGQAPGRTNLASGDGNHSSLAGSGPRLEAIYRGADGRFYALTGDGYVCEGGVVKGYRVRKINADSVEFEKDGKVWVQEMQ